MFPITVSSFGSGANLLTVINNGLTFLGVGLEVSVDERFVLAYFCFSEK